MNKEKRPLDEPLITTKNSLSDVINWLKAESYVVIYDRGGRFFHKCNKETLTNDEITEYLNNHRFIYINVSKMPGLLDDGEWNWYIKQSGFDECECSLKKTSAARKNIPHSYTLSI